VTLARWPAGDRRRHRRQRGRSPGDAVGTPASRGRLPGARQDLPDATMAADGDVPVPPARFGKDSGAVRPLLAMDDSGNRTWETIHHRREHAVCVELWGTAAGALSALTTGTFAAS